MNRTPFEDSLIRNAADAHQLCRARGVSAVIGVPAYLTGYALGGVLVGAQNLASRLAPRRTR